MIKIAPSILSANFATLGEEVKMISDLGADYIHIDVMDGHYVPNITLGPAIVEAIRPYTEKPFDVHLMIENPDAYIESFVKAGADIITVHVEATRHLHRTLQLIKQYHVQCGVVLNPHTPLEMIKHVLGDVDWVLLMSVNPGFGGQSFIPSTLEKIKALKELREASNHSFLIEVDGGVNDETARLCEEAGADVLVAGSAVFNAKDRAEAIKLIKGE